MGAPTKDKLRIEYRRLDKIQRAARNPKEHDLGALHQSIERHGFTSPLLLDEATARLVAGHGRLEALVQLRKGGKAPPAGVRQAPDGEWLVPVVRGLRFKNAAEAEAYLLADNRIVELGGWDKAGLATVLGDLAKANALEGSGFDVGDLNDLLKDLGQTGKTAGQLDEIPPAPRKAVAKRGELWTLGRHRLYCEDSTRLEKVKKAAAGLSVGCVVTDPPYAIYGSSTGISSEITDDKLIRPFFVSLLQNVGELLPWFGHAYVCCDWRSWPSIWEAARQSPMVPKNLVIWDKGGGGLGSNYANTYEAVGFLAKLPQQKALTSREKRGQRPVHRPNLVRFNRVPQKDRGHNAAKPVGLFAEFVTNSTDPGAVVLDPFLGSGTTIVACEDLGRACVGMELEPRFVDVAIQRWEKLTGGKAKKG